MAPVFYTTGTAARETGYSVETIRNLDKRGVVKPRRDATGRRIFTYEDLSRIRAYRRRHEGAAPDTYGNAR